MSSLELKRGSRWRRLRYQLGGALFVAAIVPFGLRVWALPSNDALILPVMNGFLGSVVAIIVGTWLFRNVSTYPGVEKTAYVLPAFTLSYTVLLLFFIVSRLDYNRTVLIAGYLLSVAWYIALQSRLNREAELRIGVVPFGQQERLERLSRVSWVTLSNIDDPVRGLDAVTADLRSDLPSEWDRRLADFALAGLPVYHTKHLIESLTGRVELEHLSENSFGSLAPVSAYMSFKAVADWIAALIAGILLLPFLVLVGIAIRLGTPGPALFQQRRMGYKGEPFTVYKFRTMRVVGDTPDPRNSAMTQHSDARITPFGRFLRKSRVDELPQIFNILRGEMSWIGPRPEAEVLSRWYEAEIPFYRYRHIVRPGITGWAQVCQGHVTELDEVQSKLHYDFYYIKNFSAWIDLLIVARTIRTMLTGFGSR